MSGPQEITGLEHRNCFEWGAGNVSNEKQEMFCLEHTHVLIGTQEISGLVLSSVGDQSGSKDLTNITAVHSTAFKRSSVRALERSSARALERSTMNSRYVRPILGTRRISNRRPDRTGPDWTGFEHLGPIQFLLAFHAGHAQYSK